MNDTTIQFILTDTDKNQDTLMENYLLYPGKKFGKESKRNILNVRVKTI